MSTLPLLSALVAVSAVAQSSDTLVAVADQPRGVLEAVEELRVGTLDGRPEETFGFVSGVAVGPDYTLYVGDAQASVVRVFDPTGAYRGDIGGPGEGPGEFQGVSGVELTPDGRVAVWGGRRMSIFSSDGTYRESFQVDLRSLVGGPGVALEVDTAGRYWIRTSRDVLPTREIVYAWVRYSQQGEFVDSVFPPVRHIEGSPWAFRTETLGAPSPFGYFVTGRNDQYTLHRPLRDGRILRIEREFERIPLEGEERSEWEAYVAEAGRRMEYDAPPLSEEKPVWRSLAVDREGRIWVERYTQARKLEQVSEGPGQMPPISWEEPGVFDVISPLGAFLGTVRLPGEAEFLYARGDRLWVLQSGEYDEQYVVRYRVEGLG